MFKKKELANAQAQAQGFIQMYQMGWFDGSKNKLNDKNMEKCKKAFQKRFEKKVEEKIK